MKVIVILLVAVAAVLFPQATAAAGEMNSVKAEIDIRNPGADIGTNFSGLSFEASLLLPDKNGFHYFRPDNDLLIHLFQTLGIKSLRIGGNTSDRDATRLPGPADWDSLFAFAKISGVKVIYCLHLYKGDPQLAIQTVKYISEHYAPLVDCFSIGQEPSAYPVTNVDRRPATERMGEAVEKYSYAAYAREWSQFAADISAAVPDVKFSGPGVHDNPEWAREFITDFGRSNHVVLITEHLYPGGPGGKVPSPEIGREQMLADGFVKKYENLHAGFVPLATANGLPYRLEEVNNYYNSGATNVSNTFASALWGLDFMYWWAEHEAAGLNFHTGDRVASGSTMQPCKYTAFYSTTTGFVVRPLGYALKAFAMGSRGRMVAETISNPQHLNLSLYAVLGDDQKLYVTVINKENGFQARSAELNLQVNGHDFTNAETMSLTAPGNDPAAVQGQTLGGAEIKEDSSWNGRWTPLRSPNTKHRSEGALKLEIPPASAWIIRLNANQVTELSSK